MSVFYGVGTGPGDPKLLTLLAVETIERCPVIVIPSSQKEECRAYRIVGATIPEIEKKEIIELPFPMKMSSKELERFHHTAADVISETLAEEKDVAFLTIGDPTLYSTYIYIADELKKIGYECRAIPGISSAFAAAATVGTDLAMKDEEVHIIPGSANPIDALDLPGTKVFMKSRSGYGRLLTKLHKLEAEGKVSVYAVSEIGMEDEAVYMSSKELEKDPGYLTTLIVKDRK